MTPASPQVLADSPELPPDRARRRWEWIAVGSFSLLAATRLAIFIAAFPFFNSVDESVHFDLMVKYSHGELPRGLDPFCAEASRLIAMYGSPEYFSFRRDLPGGKVGPPVWLYPAPERDKVVREYTAAWQSRPNYESIQMPLYYVLDGMWYSLGKALGLEGGRLLYWARFFTVPVYFLLVWLAYVLAKELLPERRFVYLGVPLLLIFFPQDIFYGLNNDILSAPVVALALYLLLRLYRSEAARPGLALAAGLMVAAAMLTKFSNAPLAVVAAAVAFVKVGPAWRKKQPLRHLVPALLLLAAASIPVAGWLVRNYFVFGDLMGYALNNKFKTWTPKPIREYWHHPLFTPKGFFYYWWMLFTTFWRGEMFWYGDELAKFRPMDNIYFISSAAFLIASAVAAIAHRGSGRAETRLATGLCWLMFALQVLILLQVSVSFDFGNSFYPSRHCPYAYSGRLIMGSLVPILILYMAGFEAITELLHLKFLRVPLLILVADLIVVVEICYSMPVFASQYNWFHLP
jgi:hypothetical protein